MITGRRDPAASAIRSRASRVAIHSAPPWPLGLLSTVNAGSCVTGTPAFSA